MTEDAIETYLPTLELAAQHGVVLPDWPISEQRPLVALVVTCVVQRRTTWHEDKTLTQADLAELRSDEPPIPEDAKRHEYLRLDRVLSREGGFPRVRLAQISDQVDSLHEVLVPSLLRRVPAMLAFESAIEHLIAGRCPDCLRCTDLRSHEQGSAYRGGSRRRELSFHGHDFADTIDLAEHALKRFFLRGRILKERVDAWAWPFLWLRYGKGEDREIALTVGQDKKVHAFVGSA